MNRVALAQAISETLSPKPWALALIEGGSAAFGRADAWSDLDLVLTVENGSTELAVTALEEVLERSGGISLQWQVPPPAWHGAWQAFYRLKQSPEFFLVDVCISERKLPWGLTERERHGEPIVLFDKDGIVRVTEMSEQAIEAIVRAKLPQLSGALEMFADFPLKELKRGRLIDAIGFYQSLVLGRVVGLLRLRYSPARHDFGLRYLYTDLPPERAREVEELCLVTGADDLRAKVARALTLGREVAAEIRSLERD